MLCDAANIPHFVLLLSGWVRRETNCYVKFIECDRLFLCMPVHVCVCNTPIECSSCVTHLGHDGPQIAKLVFTIFLKNICSLDTILLYFSMLLCVNHYKTVTCTC